MNNDLKNILFKILEIIGYTADKEAFVKEFTEAVSAHAYVNLLALLSPESERKLEEELKSHEQTSDAVLEVLHLHFTQTQIQKVFNQTFQAALSEWMTTIVSSLTQEQKQQIKGLSDLL